MTIRTVIVDRHPLYVDGLSRVLSELPDIEVVGTATTLERAIDEVRCARPTVVIGDCRLPDAPQHEVLERLTSAHPDASVLVLTDADDPKTFNDALASGCRGFVTKDSSADELTKAVRSVHRGEVFITQRMLVNLLPAFAKPGRRGRGELTDRELAILTMVTDGMTNQEIGDRLFLSVNTVRNHVQKVLTKLDAHSRLEAVLIANREGLVTAHVRRTVEAALRDAS